MGAFKSMRILCLKCDQFSFRAVASTAQVTLDAPENASGEWLDCMVLLVSVEEGDSAKEREIAKSVIRVLRRSKAQSVVVNGFAHLSDNLASIDESIKVLETLNQRLLAVDFIDTVSMAPFGWRKEMSLTIDSGPLSQKFIHV